MRRARTTNWCGLVRLRTSVSSAWCCSFVNSMDTAANRAMLVSTSAEFIALQYRWYKLFRYPVLVGDRLVSRRFDTQVTEVHVRVAALHGMTSLGMPVSVPVGGSLSCIKPA